MAHLRPTAHTCVSFLPLRSTAQAHEVATNRAIAQRLAALLECEFVTDARAPTAPQPPGYVVPDDTLTSPGDAQRFGIHSENDLFGGVVPWAYMAGKTVSHPLVSPSAVAPEGWCADFPLHVIDRVLPGYSVFSKGDAAVAARSLLRQGPVRLKLASGIGGSGQTEVPDLTQLDSALAALAESDVQQGLVVELNLARVRTFSVGQVRIGDWVASYVGEQHITRNRAGIGAYGGSSLTVARGGWEQLSALVEEPHLQRAVEMACAYHRAAMALLSGMFASRCNYDVACGVDAQGQWRMGVLEQSWRIGGASGAEVAALEAFASDASLQSVQASTVEEYSVSADLPQNAIVYFKGIDPHIGPITKYAVLHHDALPRRRD